MTSRIVWLFRLVLSAALPADLRGPVLRDLDEEFQEFVQPTRSRLASTLWYLRQVRGSIVPALAMRARRSGRPHLEATRHAPLDWLRDLFQDLRQTLRFLRARPGFALAASSAMALGIGANTAIFSIVDGVLLRPLPYPNPAHLVRVWSASPRGIARNSVSPPDFFDFRDGATGFNGLAAFTLADTFTLGGFDEPIRVIGSTVSPELFVVLDINPWRGRTFVREDARAERPSVAVVSHRLWTRLESTGSGAQIGGSIVVDGSPHTIVGVMPGGFSFPSAGVDIWVPLSDAWRARSRSARFLDVVGRLSTEVTIEQGSETLRTIARRLETDYEVDRGWGVTVAGLRESIVGEVRRPLIIMLGAVGCLLMIACANVASLLLTRGLSRAREMAVRAALGAGRARLVRQQLIESCALALAGGAIGVVFAGWSLELLRVAGGFDLPRLEHVRLDDRVLLATLALSLSTGVGIGLIPAWRSIRDEPGAALKSGGRRVVAAGHRARSALMTAQIALTLALTMCAGLLTRSLLQVSSIDSGFRADRVLLAQVSLPASRYPADRWATFFDDALQGIRALPAVEAAGAGAPLPLSGQEGLLRFGVRIEGWSQPEGAYDRVYLRWATPDYFRAMGIRLIRGRSFSDADLPTSAPVAVVDESFVQRYLPGEDPIGRNVRSSNDRVWRRVIGIVGAVHQSTLEAGPEPHLYVASRQLPSPSMTFVVRTSGDPLSLAPAVREQIRRVDSAQPVYNIRPLEELIDDALVTRRFNTRLLTLFATLAGILTMVGVYGMMSFAVGESTGEIGVRLALGADRQRILTLLVTRLALPVSIGTACGIALGLAGGRAISALLFGVSEHDPLTMAGAIAAMIAAAATGVFLPARRALAIDPAESLRAE